MRTSFRRETSQFDRRLQEHSEAGQPNLAVALQDRGNDTMRNGLDSVDDDSTDELYLDLGVGD